MNTEWTPPGNNNSFRGTLQPMPQSAAGGLAPDGSGGHTNRSFRHNDDADLNYMSSTSPRGGQPGNPFSHDPAEEVVFSSLAQQQPPPRERPMGTGTPRNRQQLPSALGGPNHGFAANSDDLQGEKLEQIALPLATFSLGIGAPCCSVPATICAWGCCCCQVQEKRRRSIWALIFAILALLGGMAIIIGGVAGWSNREILIELYNNYTNPEVPQNRSSLASSSTTKITTTLKPVPTIPPATTTTTKALTTTKAPLLAPVANTTTTTTTTRTTTTTKRVRR